MLLLLTFSLNRLVPQQHCESISLTNPTVAVFTSCHLPLVQGLVLADILEATYSLDDELLVEILMLLVGGYLIESSSHSVSFTARMHLPFVLDLLQGGSMLNLLLLLSI